MATFKCQFIPRWRPIKEIGQELRGKSKQACMTVTGPVSEVNGDLKKERPKEVIKRGAGYLWMAKGDGSCMFYCVLGSNRSGEVAKLRKELASFVEAHRDDVVPKLGMTVADMLGMHGCTCEEYAQSVQGKGHWKERRN